jgi:hypothetical protein
MNTETIILYDPLDRKLNLNRDLSPFFSSEGNEWNNCSIQGTYVKDCKYFLMKRIVNLGLKCVQEVVVNKDDVDILKLMVYLGNSINNGDNISESEISEMKELSGNLNLIINQSVQFPPGPAYDDLRNMYTSIKRALEIFKK